MLTIRVENIGKKFKNEWIFRNLSCTFESGNAYAVTGPNGSGKSTFIQGVTGVIPLNEGVINYHNDGKEVPEEHWYRMVALAAPYMELVEELTLKEAVDFHTRFKPLSGGLTVAEFLESIHLGKHAGKPLKNFSSGMKQRLKLGLAFYTETPVLFLDEPTSNLDHAGFDWYLSLIEKFAADRIVIISSNEPEEYNFCHNSINILDFKS